MHKDIVLHVIEIRSRRHAWNNDLRRFAVITVIPKRCDAPVRKLPLFHLHYPCVIISVLWWDRIILHQFPLVTIFTEYHSIASPVRCAPLAHKEYSSIVGRATGGDKKNLIVREPQRRRSSLLTERQLNEVCGRYSPGLCPHQIAISPRTTRLTRRP